MWAGAAADNDGRVALLDPVRAKVGATMTPGWAPVEGVLPRLDRIARPPGMASRRESRRRGG